MNFYSLKPNLMTLIHLIAEHKLIRLYYLAILLAILLSNMSVIPLSHWKSKKYRGEKSLQISWNFARTTGTQRRRRRRTNKVAQRSGDGKWYNCWDRKRQPATERAKPGTRLRSQRGSWTEKEINKYATHSLIPPRKCCTLECVSWGSSTGICGQDAEFVSARASASANGCGCLFWSRLGRVPFRTHLPIARSCWRHWRWGAVSGAD